VILDKVIGQHGRRWFVRERGDICFTEFGCHAVIAEEEGERVSRREVREASHIVVGARCAGNGGGGVGGSGDCAES